MPYSFFHERFPEIAERETRCLTVLPHSDIDLPPGEYAFLDMYCNEVGCDCRRVFLFVVAQHLPGPQAVIAWGWEDLSFYREWFKYGDDDDARLLKGPTLNMGSPETEHSPKLLKLASEMLLSDADYVERIKRHYRMFREDIEGHSRPRRRPPKRRKRRSR